MIFLTKSKGLLEMTCLNMPSCEFKSVYKRRLQIVLQKQRLTHSGYIFVLFGKQLYAFSKLIESIVTPTNKVRCCYLRILLAKEQKSPYYVVQLVDFSWSLPLDQVMERASVWACISINNVSFLAIPESKGTTQVQTYTKKIKLKLQSLIS